MSTSPQHVTQLQPVPRAASGVSQAIRPLAATSTAQACRGGNGPHPGALAGDVPAGEVRRGGIPARSPPLVPLPEAHPVAAKATASSATADHRQVLMYI